MVEYLLSPSVTLGTMDGSRTTHLSVKLPLSVHGHLSESFFIDESCLRTVIEPKHLNSNPITDATDPTLSCNDDGTSSALQLTAPITAGEEITAYWNIPWPHPYGPMVSVFLFSPRVISETNVLASLYIWLSALERLALASILTLSNGLAFVNLSKISTNEMSYSVQD